MAEEKIEIKSTRDITVITYFTNVEVSQTEAVQKNAGSKVKIPWGLIKDEGVLGHGLIGSDGVVIELLQTIDGTPVRRVGGNKFEALQESEMPKVTTGFTYEYKMTKVANDNFKNYLSSQIKLEGYNISGSSANSYVGFSERPTDDYSVDITIQRTFDTLDTLSVKNNPLSEYPNQESDTGVLFGTLMASQKIIDANGDRIKIPLSNVPVVLFNPSTEFPQISSVDDDGNRITLNLIENSNFEDYPNIESFVLDVGKENAEEELGETLGSRFDGIQPLLKEENSITVPEKYRYSTITNDKGEFILQNVPTGPQVLMFEVDLLKQGLTKEEVALNNFRYPADSAPNVDSVPHYFFRQIPVNIVPAWGNFQTGYTRTDITAAIDMRKWGTFFISPVSFADKSIDELLGSGYFDPVTVIARDMTRPEYPLVNEIVEISEIFNRNQSQRMEWFGEFRTQKPTIDFRSSGYHAFKLPANMYDPEGEASADSDRRNLRSAKGVWLCSYQMKTYYGRASNVYRSTGFIRNTLANEAKTASHFDLNRGVDSSSASATGEEEKTSIGKFPYEQPWTINYPEPYKIPRRPFVKNESISFSNKVEPRYLDGDLAGDYANEDSEEPKGFGLMQSIEDGQPIHNRFSQSITKAKVYRYESDVAWHEEYSNGYRKQYHASLFPGKNFEVLNGEKYQRVEAGFAYWIKPEGWGRIAHHSWGDIMASSDINSSYGAAANYIPSTYVDTMSRFGETLAIRMDTSTSPDWLQTGGLDFYRVIDDSPEALIPAGPPFLKKIIKIQLQNMWRNKKKTGAKLQFDVAGDRSKLIPIGTATVDIRNNGSIATEVTAGGVSEKLNPGETKPFQIFSGAEIVLPSNIDFNIEENFYRKSSYSFRFKNSEIENAGEVAQDASINEEAGNLSEPPLFYMVSRYENAKGNVKIKNDGEIKCKDSYQKTGTYDLNGYAFEWTGSQSAIRFQTEKISPHCTTSGIEIFRID